MRSNLIRYENVAVSTRIRLARNFADYPFPNKLKDAEMAREIVKLVANELNYVDTFDLYYMNTIPEEKAVFLKECYLISRDLLRRRPYAAVLVSRPEYETITFEEELNAMLGESISVMINEEDHIREQSFVRGFDLRRGYERISGIDDIISEAIPFAFDRELGYLTACPSNLGTGMRASVMLFLPALSRRGKMKEIERRLKYLGLTVRGAFGEGSGADGDLFQISNEVTLGVSEEEIVSVVEENVDKLVEDELSERAKMKEEGGFALVDKILRSYGILTNCVRLDPAEFTARMTDVKLGVALGIFDGAMEELDHLLIAMRPANICRLSGMQPDEEGQAFFRAEYAGRKLRSMELLTEQKRNELSLRE